jgi:hypothetical protein
MTHTHDSSEYNQTDEMVKGKRRNPWIVAILSLVLVSLLGYLFGFGFAKLFKLPSLLGTSFGLGLAGLGVMWILPKLYVVNDAVSAFVTIDMLASLKGSEHTLVTYGPGFHITRPWEKRVRGNNVDLAEAAENFSFAVQTPTGNLDGKFSIRLRPDITRLPEFLAGVASVAADLGDIIKAEVIGYLGNKPLTDALKGTSVLNINLAAEFKHGKAQGEKASAFEKRFGVIIGDITVSELMPSKATQETMSAETESAVIDAIVASSFGKKTMQELQEAVDAKTISQDEVNRRRNQTMAMSGNLQGMDFSESTFNLRISGLDKVDPAIAQAITAIGPHLAKFAGQKQPAGKKPAQPKKEAPHGH